MVRARSDSASQHTVVDKPMANSREASTCCDLKELTLNKQHLCFTWARWLCVAVQIILDNV